MNHLVLIVGMAIALSTLLCWLCHWWKYRGAVQMANTIPLEKCRQIVGDECGLADSELTVLRDQLYRFAGVVVEACPHQRRGNGPRNAPDAARQAIDHTAGTQQPQKPASFPDAVALLPDDDRYEVEERAAIMEHDGRIDRNVAEQDAFSLYWRRINGGS